MIENAHTNLKLVITGCPCSGTKYTAGMLEAHGFDAIHEGLDYKRAEDLWWSPGDRAPEIDVSYTLRQWFDVEPLKHLPAVWLVRDPVKVINSFLAKGLIGMGVIDVNECMRQLASYNRQAAAAPNLVCTHRVEDPDAELVAVVSRYCEIRNPLTPYPARTHNKHNPGVVNLTREHLMAYDEGPDFFASYKGLYDFG